MMKKLNVLSVINPQVSCQNCEYVGESPISGDHCEGCRNFSNYKKKKDK